MKRTGYLVIAVGCFVVALLLVGYAAAQGAPEEQPLARTAHVSVPSGGRIAIYPAAGFTSSSVRWKCGARGTWRQGYDYIRPGCNYVVLWARFWFDYEVLPTAQQDARGLGKTPGLARLAAACRTVAVTGRLTGVQCVGARCSGTLATGNGSNAGRVTVRGWRLRNGQAYTKRLLVCA